MNRENRHLYRRALSLFAALAASSALLAGCGSDSASRKGPSSRPDQPQAFVLSDTDKADIACAEEIEAEAKKACKTTENLMPGHLDRVTEAWKSFGKRCLPGMRAAAELRRLEKCIDRLEEVPGQVDEVVIQRRIDSRGSVAALKTSPEYEAANREIQEALGQFSDLAWKCKRAIEKERADKVEKSCGAWRAMEERYSKARRSIEMMMVDHGLSPMDARYLGLL